MKYFKFSILLHNQMSPQMFSENLSSVLYCESKKVKKIVPSLKELKTIGKHRQGNRQS